MVLKAVEKSGTGTGSATNLPHRFAEVLRDVHVHETPALHFLLGEARDLFGLVVPLVHLDYRRGKRFNDVTDFYLKNGSSKGYKLLYYVCRVFLTGEPRHRPCTSSVEKPVISLDLLFHSLTRITGEPRARENAPHKDPIVGLCIRS